MSALTEVDLGQEPVAVKAPEQADERYHSVTTVLGVLEKPALLYWVAEQAAKAACAVANTLPARIEEDGEDAVVKWLRDARFRRPKDVLSDTEFGTQIHGLCESYALTGVKPVPSVEVFHGDVDAAQACLDRFDEWLAAFQPSYQATEVVVYHTGYGYAGTSDAFLTLDGTPLVVDYKSSKKSFDARGNPSPIYPETALQLAMYRHAEFAAVWRPRIHTKFRRRYYLLSDAERAQAVPVPPVDGGLGVKITPEHCTAYPVRCDQEIFEAALYVLECARWSFDLSKTVIGDPLVAS